MVKERQDNSPNIMSHAAKGSTNSGATAATSAGTNSYGNNNNDHASSLSRKNNKESSPADVNGSAGGLDKMKQLLINQVNGNNRQIGHYIVGKCYKFNAASLK